MEGKHTKIVTKSNDDLISINDTDNFDYSMQDKMTHKSCEGNNYNNDYEELSYPFSKRIKLKHEPEKAQENIPVQYTADIIVEIKNRDGTVVPMRALLDTGTKATIILREFVGKGRARTNTKKSVKLLPLPQPPVRAHTDARTNPSAQRATQLRSVIAHVCTVSIQNQITTTVP
jgi:hypothetical protein